VGFGSEEESFEGGGEVCLVFGVEALGCFEGEPEFEREDKRRRRRP